MNHPLRIPLLALTILALAALACNMNSGGAGPGATSAVETLSAVLTASATAAGGASATPSETPPASPTATSSPTLEATAEVKPSDTAAPTNTTGPQGCADSAEYVADVTVPDNTIFATGTGFTKTWRLRNAGTCTWVSSYSFVFVSGEQLSAPASVAITGNVAPGSLYDVSVNMVAPAGAGAYKGTWQMRAPGGALFGTKPFVQIVVAAGATPTFTATATSGPSLTPTATSTLQTLSWPLVKQGDTGPNVYAVQYLLRQQGYVITADGNFGPATRASVQGFQASQGLAADGIVGAQTWPKLIVTVQSGSSGEAVKAAQYLLKNKYGYVLDVDGAFGPITDQAVKDFETSQGLASDGVVGSQTWSALVSGP